MQSDLMRKKIKETAGDFGEDIFTAKARLRAGARSEVFTIVFSQPLS